MFPVNIFPSTNPVKFTRGWYIPIVSHICLWFPILSPMDIPINSPAKPNLQPTASCCSPRLLLCSGFCQTLKLRHQWLLPDPEASTSAAPQNIAGEKKWWWAIKSQKWTSLGYRIIERILGGFLISQIFSNPLFWNQWTYVWAGVQWQQMTS